MEEKHDFSGMWRCTYWFPSNKFVGDEPSQYYMKSREDGNLLVFESEPNDEQSHMFVRLTIDGDVATGTWHETTSLTGEFNGALYSGAGQLIVDAKTRRMEGMWAGAGYDRKLKKRRIYTGNWEIVPADVN